MAFNRDEEQFNHKPAKKMTRKQVIENYKMTVMKHGIFGATGGYLSKEESIKNGFPAYYTEEPCDRCGSRARAIVYDQETGKVLSTSCKGCRIKNRIQRIKKGDTFDDILVDYIKSDRKLEDLKLKRLEEGDYWDDFR